MKSVSFIIPAYNEEEGVEDCLKQVYKALDDTGVKFELILVDDASTDDTLKHAQKVKEQNYLTHLKVLTNTENKGQGYSLRRGFDEARYDILVHNSVDLPFSMKDWSTLYEKTCLNDMVVVQRKQRTGYTFFRVCLSHVYVSMVNTFFGYNLSDYSFIQSFTKDLYLAGREPSIKSTVFFMPSLILNALNNGFKVSVLNCEYQARKTGVATGASLKNIINGLKDLVDYKLQGRYFDRKRF